MYHVFGKIVCDETRLHDFIYQLILYTILCNCFKQAMLSKTKFPFKTKTHKTKIIKLKRNNIQHITTL